MVAEEGFYRLLSFDGLVLDEEIVVRFLSCKLGPLIG